MLEKRSHLPDSAGDRTICIERTFDAPRELVFDAWTNPETFDAVVCARQLLAAFRQPIDVRRGGTFRFIASAIRRSETAGASERTRKYRDRSVWSLRWPVADRHGNKVASSDAGHDAQWPPETTLVVTRSTMSTEKRA